jgi:hypothetical protein
MHVSPPVRGWVPLASSLRKPSKMPKEIPQAFDARTFRWCAPTLIRRVSPGSGIVWLLCRAPLFCRVPFLRGPLCDATSGGGDPQHHAVLPALFAETLNEHEDLVLGSELGQENVVQSRGHLVA